MGLFGKKKKDDKKFEFRLVNRYEKDSFFQILAQQGWFELEPPFEFDKNWDTDRIRRAAKAYSLKLGAEMLVEVDDPSFSSNIYNDLVFYVFKMDPAKQAPTPVPQQAPPQASQYSAPPVVAEQQYAPVNQQPARDCAPPEQFQQNPQQFGSQTAYDPYGQAAQRQMQGTPSSNPMIQGPGQAYDQRFQQGQHPNNQFAQQPGPGYDPRMQQPEAGYDPRMAGYNPQQQAGAPYGQQPMPADPYQQFGPPPGSGYPDDGRGQWGAPPQEIPYQPDEEGRIKVTDSKELFLRSNYTSHEEAFLHTLDNLSKMLSMEQSPFKFLDQRELLHPIVRIKKKAYLHLGTRQMNLVLMKEAINDYKIMGNESHALSNVNPMRDNLVVIKTLGTPIFQILRDYDELDEQSKGDITQSVFSFLECYLPKM